VVVPAICVVPAGTVKVAGLNEFSAKELAVSSAEAMSNSAAFLTFI
jgi:hypothetical protein